MADDGFSRRSLEGAGFRGFVTFDALEPSTVSPDPGVYVVLRDADSRPTLLEVSVGGHFKGRNPSVPVQVLDKRWVHGASVLYIGKATSLRTRLRQFREFGADVRSATGEGGTSGRSGPRVSFSWLGGSARIPERRKVDCCERSRRATGVSRSQTSLAGSVLSMPTTKASSLRP
jgi:hypothetical protein